MIHRRRTHTGPTIAECRRAPAKEVPTTSEGFVLARDYTLLFSEVSRCKNLGVIEPIPIPFRRCFLPTVHHGRTGIQVTFTYKVPQFNRRLTVANIFENVRNPSDFSWRLSRTLSVRGRRPHPRRIRKATSKAARRRHRRGGISTKRNIRILRSQLSDRFMGQDGRHFAGNVTRTQRGNEGES